MQSIKFILLKPILSLLLMIISSSAALATEYYWFKTSTASWKKSGRENFLDERLKISVLDSLDRIYSKTPTYYTFFFNGDNFQCHIQGGFDLYSIKGDSIKLVYNLFNKGYNQGAISIIRNSNNYLLGGHGFWSRHIDLLVFEPAMGSWELVKTINQPIDYFSDGIFQNSKGVYSIFGEYYNPRTNLYKKEANGYFLDWETKVWKPIDVIIDGVENSNFVNKSFSQYLETKDYIFMVSNSEAYMVSNIIELKNIGWNIIEKESGKIYYYGSLVNDDVFSSSFIEVIGNKVNYLSQYGNPNSLDVEYLKSLSKEVGKIIVVEKSLLSELSINDIFYKSVIAILLSFIIVGLIFLKWGKSNISNENNELDVLIASLSIYSGERINTDNLDILLKIDSMSIDSKRLKRSRMIKKLNDYYLSKNGKKLISREKDPEDKRYVFYSINK